MQPRLSKAWELSDGAAAKQWRWEQTAKRAGNADDRNFNCGGAVILVGNVRFGTAND